jgi:hypothetical protein
VVLITDESHAGTPRSPMPPNAYAIGIAFTATLLVATALGSAGSRAAGGVGLTVMAATVGVSAWWCRPSSSLCAGAFGWLMFNGFVTDQFGTLTWHGAADGVRLGALVIVALGVAVTRAVMVAAGRRVLLEDITHSANSHIQPISPALAQGDTHA